MNEVFFILSATLEFIATVEFHPVLSNERNNPYLVKSNDISIVRQSGSDLTFICLPSHQVEKISRISNLCPRFVLFYCSKKVFRLFEFQFTERLPHGAVSPPSRCH